jgi:hypothetical protein
MDRQALLRCAKLALAAADNATISASFANIRPGKAADWKALTRAALNEALAELDKAEPRVARAIEAARSEPKQEAA